MPATLAKVGSDERSEEVGRVEAEVSAISSPVVSIGLAIPSAGNIAEVKVAAEGWEYCPRVGNIATEYWEYCRDNIFVNGTRLLELKSSR